MTKKTTLLYLTFQSFLYSECCDYDNEIDIIYCIWNFSSSTKRWTNFK